jgi:hypothetical protein
MLTIRAMSDGIGYASNHLEHRDYYAEGERVAGLWQGRGAELLGLAGNVKSEDFEALREVVIPKREFLRQRKAPIASLPMEPHSPAEISPISRSRASLFRSWLSGRRQSPHRGARTELEVYAAARVRREGANEDRTTGNLVLAVYHHDTSRELDPQLHAHAVASNLSFDGTEGRWKALQASGIYELRAYLTEVYRNVLAHEVRSLGYEIEDRRDARGRDAGFEIRGISDELLTKYSQRSQQRDAAVQQFVRQNGRQPTDNEVAVLIRETRAEKLTEISTAEVRQRQRERLTPGI